MSEPDAASPPTHPEELSAALHLQAGPVSLRALARATPAGFVGIALVLLSVATVVWAPEAGCNERGGSRVRLRR